MRKRIIPLASTTVAHEPLLDLDSAATVEVTSEDKAFPIEAAISPKDSRGWRAANRELRQFDYSLISPKTCTISRFFSRKNK